MNNPQHPLNLRSPTWIPAPASPASPRGFSLVELLSVMTVIVLLMAMAGNIFRADTRRADVNLAIDDLGGLLQVGRWEARSKATYVWLCLEPVDNGAETGVAVAMFASRDGTSSSSPGNLSQVAPRRVLKRVTLAGAASSTPTRLAEDYGSASIDLSALERVGHSTATIDDGSARIYSGAIICFNPRGEALVPGGAGAGSIEVLLQPLSGGPDSDAKSSAILVSRSTGSSQVYR